MTPVPSGPRDNTEQEREELRDIIAGWPFGAGYYQYMATTDDASELLEALWPTIDRIATARGITRAQEELRAAADELHVLRFNAAAEPEARWPEGAPQVAPDSFYRGINLATLALRARADALGQP